MNVSEVMTKDVISVNVPGRRKKAFETMQKYNVSGLPVVDEKTKKLVGMISLEDLLKHPDEEQIALLMSRLVVTAKTDDDIVEAVKMFFGKDLYLLPVVEQEKLMGILTVEDIVKRGISKMESEKICEQYMKHSVACAWYGTPMSHIVKIMEYSHSLAVVLLDERGNPVGVIDNSDLIKHGEIVNETERTSMNGNSDDDWTWDTKSTLYIGTCRLKLPNKPVKEYMTGDIHYVSPTTPVTECARLMRRYDIEQLPVIDEKNELVGIIRDVDIVRFLLEE